MFRFCKDCRNGVVPVVGLSCGPLYTGYWAFARLEVESFVHKVEHFGRLEEPARNIILQLSMKRQFEIWRSWRSGNSSGL
jgi:hypothetical protein